MCKAKIHRATVTEAKLAYTGSITIDTALLEAANILPFEMVQVTNVSNATLWHTYAIPAPEGSGTICLNGPPARLFQPGDEVIILSKCWMTDEEILTLQPKVIFVDEHNQIISITSHQPII